MATTNEKNWMMRYNEQKTYVAVCYYFPDKHKVEFLGLLNWANIPERKSRQVLFPKTKDSSLKY